MNTIRQTLQGYLDLRRGLGFKLETAGAALSSFVGYLEQAGAEYIAIEHAVAWARLPTLAQLRTGGDG